MAILITQAVDFGSQVLSSVGSPSVGTDAANKQYVDNAIQGLDWKASVRAASTGNITLASPGATIDGVSMTNGDRFLAKDQTAGAQNGIYTWNGAATPATRAPDASTSALVSPGMAVSVEAGSVNADKTYLLITDAPITLDTTALAFTSMSGGGTTYTAGNGLTLSGAQFSAVAGTGISVGASITIDTAVVPRKYATNVGNGSLTSIAVTHSLATYDVQVEVFLNSGNRTTVLCEVQRTDVNTVTLVFGTAPSSSAYRCVVLG